MPHDWTEALKETERLEKFLAELTQLSLKHNVMIDSSAISIHKEGTSWKRPCGYQEDLHLCLYGNQIGINEFRTKIKWKSRTDFLQKEENEKENSL